MPIGNDKPRAGEMVILHRLPPGLLIGLPATDQRAIKRVIGKPVLLVGYDDDGRAELEFEHPTAARSSRSIRTHTIWVDPVCIRSHR